MDVDGDGEKDEGTEKKNKGEVDEDGVKLK